jgi:hypothetical protein
MSVEDHLEIHETASGLYGKLLRNLTGKSFKRDFFTDLLDSPTSNDDSYTVAENDDENWDGLSSSDNS